MEASLTRLGIDCIDLYQTHWQEATTPIADTMGCLFDLKREGKIRAIGVSNANPNQIEAYRAAGPLDADQERYSMLDRELEASNLPYCLAKSVAFLAYSPLGHGLLTGKFGGGRTLPEGDFRRDHPRFSTANVAKAEALLGVLRPLAEVRGLTLAQLVIAWTLQQLPEVIAVESLGGSISLITMGTSEGNPKWLDIPRGRQIASLAVNTVTTNAPDLLSGDASVAPVIAYLRDHKAATLARVAQVAQGFADQHSSEQRQFLLAAGSAGIDAATNEVVAVANYRMLALVYASVVILCYITFRNWRAVIVALDTSSGTSRESGRPSN